jgi:hypothetical protein
VCPFYFIKTYAAASDDPTTITQAASGKVLNCNFFSILEKPPVCPETVLILKKNLLEKLPKRHEMASYT